MTYLSDEEAAKKIYEIKIQHLRDRLHDSRRAVRNAEDALASSGVERRRERTAKLDWMARANIAENSLNHPWKSLFSYYWKKLRGYYD